MRTRTHVTAAAILSVAVVLCFGATPAMAHARLVSAEPAANASVAVPATIVLRFNEALQARLSNFKLTDIDGKAVAITAKPAPDEKSLAATPNAPLAPGLYTVSWTVAGPDAHAMKGTYSFSVK